MKNGFDLAVFWQSLFRNLAMIGVFCFGGMAGVMVFGVTLGVIAMMAGELAVLHVLAMLGMAAAFGVLAALCVAVVEGYGVKVFKDEKGDQSL